MKRQRLAGIEKEMIRVLSRVLLEEVKNPNIKGIVSITDIRVTEDLKFADTYFSIMPEVLTTNKDVSENISENNADNTKEKDAEKQRENIIKSLNEIKGFLRKRVAEEIELRFVPEIRVKIDNSIDNAMRINQILNNIKG